MASHRVFINAISISVMLVQCVCKPFEASNILKDAEALQDWIVEARR